MDKKIVGFVVLFLLLFTNFSYAGNWKKHVIGHQINPIYLYVKDMDRDGDLDIVTTTNIHWGLYNSEIAWFRNNIELNGKWDKFIISSSFIDPIQNSNGVTVDDMDGDGREDVVVGTGAVGVSDSPGNVYWFRAPVDPTDEWERFLVCSDENNAYFKMYSMDVNKDEMQDIVSGGNAGANVFINPGYYESNADFWQKRSLPGVTGSSLYLDDMNGDQRTDIINSYLGQDGVPGCISWFKVDDKGKNIIFERTDIDSEVSNPFDVSSLDVNGDEKMDVVVTIFRGKTIYWYEAPEKKSGLWTQHLVSDTFNGTDIYAGDINGDGQDDIVVSGLFISKISWFESVSDNGDIQWVEHLIDDEIIWPGDVSLDDIDQDGDLDLVVAGMGEAQVIWYENKISKSLKSGFSLISLPDGKRGWLVSSAIEAVVP
jgi:hypothetical protein